MRASMRAMQGVDHVYISCPPDEGSVVRRSEPPPLLSCARTSTCISVSESAPAGKKERRQLQTAATRCNGFTSAFPRGFLGETDERDARVQPLASKIASQSRKKEGRHRRLDLVHRDHRVSVRNRASNARMHHVLKTCRTDVLVRTWGYRQHAEEHFAEVVHVPQHV